MLDRAPETLTLAFTEHVELAAARISLVDGDGRHWAVTGLALRDPEGAPATEDDDSEEPVTLVAGLPALPPNTYHVAWRTLSSDDLHTTSGTLVFGVGRQVTACGFRSRVVSARSRICTSFSRRTLSRASALTPVRSSSTPSRCTRTPASSWTRFASRARSDRSASSPSTASRSWSTVTSGMSSRTSGSGAPPRWRSRSPVGSVSRSLASLSVMLPAPRWPVRRAGSAAVTRFALRHPSRAGRPPGAGERSRKTFSRRPADGHTKAAQRGISRYGPGLWDRRWPIRMRSARSSTASPSAAACSPRPPPNGPSPSSPAR
ncbi:copper resistance CopC family protein [Micromonospora sp. NPDC003776]